jgi:hypothetical protein
LFGRLADIAQKVSKIDETEILTKVWSRPFVQDFIIELNTTEQLFEGDLSNGGKMPQGNPSYISSKGSRGAPDGISTNLFLNGDFYRSFDVIPNKIGFLIDANTSIHGKDFISIYGLDILGLNEENTEKLIEFIKDQIIEEIFDFLG